MTSSAIVAGLSPKFQNDLSFAIQYAYAGSLTSILALTESQEQTHNAADEKE